MFVTLNVGIVYLMDTKLIEVIIENFLNIEEIGRLAKALSELGVSKIRLTGGEPTVRKDFFEIIKIIKENSGIKKTVMTTNGYRLDKIADDIKNSDLDGINISIDSLNADTF
jgi:cyclic pyranopterin phosphate synthase